MSATTFVPSDIDETRLKAGIERFARLSTPGRGVTRLAYSELERAAHSEFARDMTAIGLRVRTDAAGNTIAELAPTVTSIDSIGAVGTGSHLDSVPEGGRFDGIVGVVAAMEVARAAVETDFLAVARGDSWRSRPRRGHVLVRHAREAGLWQASRSRRNSTPSWTRTG